MKRNVKRLIAVILCAVISVSFPIPASAAGHVHDGVTFLPWNDAAAVDMYGNGSHAANTLPVEGSYYLTGNVTVRQTYQIGPQTELNLCLNGYTIMPSGYMGSIIKLLPESTFNLYDETGNGLITRGNGSSEEPGGVFVYGGTFNMYGGKITLTSAGGYSVGGGVAVYHGTFNMYGGEISDNRAQAGGGVALRSESVFNMYGGEISNNLAQAGGGVLVRERSCFNMFDGSVSDNVADNYGGNVFVDTGFIDMQGGVVTGGTATHKGGGIYLTASYNAANFGFTVSGAPVISGNTVNGAADDLYLGQYASSGVRALIGFSGALTDGASIGVTTGYTSITDVFTSGYGTYNSAPPSDFFFSNTDGYGVRLDGSEAQLAAEHTVTWQNHDGVTLAADTVLEGDAPSYGGATPTKPDDEWYTYLFSGWTDGENTYAANETLPAVIGDITYTALFTGSSTHVHNGVTFEPWTDSQNLPTSGSWYLTCDVIAPETQVSGTLDLCLNGHEIRQIGIGTIFRLEGSAILNLYDKADNSGTLTNGQGFQLGDVGCGGAVFLHDYSTFNMYGGTITGNTAQAGGAVYAGREATVSIYGGVITGNESRGSNSLNNGGGICVADYATLNLYGGVVTGNNSWRFDGAGIYFIGGCLNISGSPSVYGNTTVFGNESNICLSEYSVINVTGELTPPEPIGIMMLDPGIFTSGLSGNGDASCFVSDDPDCLIIGTADGEAQLVSVSDLCTVTWLNSDGNALETDVNVLIGSVPSYGGATPEKPYDGEYAYYFSGWTDGENTYAANETLPAVTGDIAYTAVFTQFVPHFHGGKTLRPWTDSENLPTSGSWYLTCDVCAPETCVSGTLDLCLNGHEITIRGIGSIYYISYGNTLNLYDNDGDAGTLTGGIGRTTSGYSTYGGAIYVEGTDAAFNMYGGTLTGNSAGAGGAVYARSGAAVSIYGGVISGNESYGGTDDSYFGAAVCINYGATLNLYGGVITGNSDNFAGGGIYFNGDAFNLSGSPYVYGNISGNVFMDQGKVINVTGELTPPATIGIMMLDPGVFTSGLSGNGDASCFVSDDPVYAVIGTADGEAQLFSVSDLCTVTWLNYDGSALETDVNVLIGSVPSYDGATPEKPYDGEYAYYFSGWTDGENTYTANETLPALTGDITYTAVYLQYVPHIHDGVTFLPWTNSESLPTEGSWYLTCDVEAVSTVRVQNVTLDLCLNGHEIRQTGNGTIFDVAVRGTLNLYDNADNQGSLTGGIGRLFTNNKRKGGAVYVFGGVVNMYGGTITGNTAGEGAAIFAGGTSSVVNIYGGVITANDCNDSTVSGGAICVDSPATLNLFGGVVTGNTSRGLHGAGINFASGSFNISGSPSVYGNTTITGDEVNVWLARMRYISVTGELTPPEPIGVTMFDPGVFTSGLSGNGDASCFTADDPDCTIIGTADGEARLVRVSDLCTVTWLNYDGSALETDVNQLIGSVPSYGGATPAKPDEGENIYIFSGWTDGENDYNSWETLPALTGDITYTAVFEQYGPHIHDGVTFLPWTDRESLPTSGSWYLIDTVSVYGTTEVDGVLDLCLTGVDVNNRTNGKFSIFTLGQDDVLNLFSDGVGDISGGLGNMVDSVTSGGAVFLDGNAVFNMYGGYLFRNYALRGGAVFMNGSGCEVNIYGGNICSNGREVGLEGGAIYVSHGTLNIYGGSIHDNEAGEAGAGIYVSSEADAFINISGDPYINYNRTNFGSASSDVYLGAGQVINIVGELSSDAFIGVETAEAGVFTNGLPGNGDIYNFFGDGPGFDIMYDAGGELKMVDLNNIRSIFFRPGEGSGYMDSPDVEYLDIYTLPECGFTAPEGKIFAGWRSNIDGAVFRPGDQLQIVETIDFTALWIRPVVQGFIVTVDGLENARDVFIVSNDSHGEYATYKEIKNSTGFTFYYRATYEKFVEGSFSVKVPATGDYTVFIRYKDATPDFHYTVTMLATGTATVTANGHEVTVTPGEYNQYGIKVARFALGAGMTTTKEIKAAAYSRAVKAADLAAADYTVYFKTAGVYSYVIEFLDGTATHGEFTIQAGDIPTVTANRITDIGANIDLIRYVEGDHGDLNMSGLKALGARVIEGSGIDRVNARYTLKEKITGTYTFCFRFSDTGEERTVVLNIADIPNSFTVGSYAELLAAVNAVEDGGEIILGKQIRRNELSDPELVIDKNITLDMNGKALTNTKGSEAENECFITIVGATVTVLNGTLNAVIV